MKMNRLAWLTIALATLAMSGCSSNRDKDAEEGTQGAVVESSGSTTNTTTMPAANPRRGRTMNPLLDPNSPLATRKIYFDFNQSEIRADSVATLRAHAAFLVQQSALGVTVEGHTDERGSREYNIALGERRAMAVKRFFETEGVNPAQINTVSYGEERPDQEGYSESAAAANRRAVIVY